VHDRVHFFDLTVFQLSRDQMKAIVDRAFAFRLLVPVVDAFDQRLTFILHGKVYDRRRPAMRRRDRAGAKVVRSGGPTEGQLHVRVWIDAAGNYQFSARVDSHVSFHVELCADDGYSFAFDQKVGFIIVSGGDDVTVFD